MNALHDDGVTRTIRPDRGDWTTVGTRARGYADIRSADGFVCRSFFEKRARRPVRRVGGSAGDFRRSFYRPPIQTTVARTNYDGRRPFIP